ncbi:hypothetical protein FNU76_10270 [Chitinimonas arctica]|uniref:Uncharacterized protein n=1 Tax=Chitinimonas arctica TaxID=2594795 RepID=A0A516SFC0_9NEIS|nr:hypothetical protein [Chitinimonas arctica]QDQ26718.1 hypothetical protein FNU76_10270 [Chitinimonas arctica]
MTQLKITGSQSTTLPNHFVDRAHVAAWLRTQLPAELRGDPAKALKRLERDGYLELVSSRGGFLVRLLAASTGRATA